MTYEYDRRGADDMATDVPAGDAKGIEVSDVAEFTKEAEKKMFEAADRIEEAMRNLRLAQRVLISKLPHGYTKMHGRPQPGDKIASMLEYVRHLLDALTEMKPRGIERLREEFHELNEFVHGKI